MLREKVGSRICYSLITYKKKEVQGGENFEFEFDIGGDSKYTSVAKRKKLRTLDKIRDLLRETLPPDGLSKGEKVNMPFGQEVCFINLLILGVHSFIFLV